MATTLKHKGYIGDLRIDIDSGLIIGKVQNIRSLLAYQGSTIAEAKEDFELAVDEYIEDCAKRGIAPESSCNGVFQVRVSVETHRRLVELAAERGIALNALVGSLLESAGSDVSIEKRSYLDDFSQILNDIHSVTKSYSVKPFSENVKEGSSGTISEQSKFNKNNVVYLKTGQQ